MNKFIMIVVASLVLAACGEVVEVPPASVGKLLKTEQLTQLI